MNKIFERNFTQEEIINTIILSVITLMPLITIKGINSPFITGKMVYLYIVGVILLTFWVKDIKKIKISTESIVVSIFIVCLTLSTILSIEPIIALLGEDGWEQGLLMYVVYILLFIFAMRHFILKEWSINVMCISACIMGGHTILQFYGIDLIFRYYLNIDRNVDMIGTIGNRNLVAIYMVIFVLIATSMYIFNGKKKYIIYSSILFGALLATLTRGGWVGVFFAFIVGGLLIIKEKVYYKRIGIVACLFLSIFLIMNFSRDNILLSRGKSIIEDATNITPDSGSGRIEIWKTTLGCIKINPIMGSGIDSLRLNSILNNVGSTHGLTKAHNEFLDYWVSGGIFTLLSYMALIIIIMRKLFKIRKDNGAKILIVLISGYLAQSFFSISVLEVAPIFWIILGASIRYYRNYNVGRVFNFIE